MNRLIVLFFALVATAAANPFSGRIVGGSDAEVGQFPYQISLRVGGSHNCGGSIINDQWILTAAHCVQGYQPSALTVVTGTITLNAGGDTYKVERTIYHPDWNAWQLSNDVGLVKIVGKIQFNDLVKPIALNTEDIQGDVELTLSGWGRTSFPGNLPNTLQWIKLRSLTTEDCQSRHSNSIFDSEICTLTKSGEGACHGDSGGPLVYEDRVAGIVSWGRPCAVGYPDVFSRVSSFADWINENISE